MEINSKLYAASRVDWRAWLAVNHESEKEIWIISNALSGTSSVSYLDAVEEAICFGWIDSIAKRLSDSEQAQRFSPRHRNSNWTELNKERARRLIRLGLMTEAGRRLLPDLSKPFVIADDILDAVSATPDAKAHFAAFPELYIRVTFGARSCLRGFS